MKRLIIGLLTSFTFFSVSYADTTTAYLGLTLPTTSTVDVWGAKLNNNFTAIDSGMSSLAGTIAGTTSFNVLRATQVFISTPTYGGSDKLAVNGQSTFFGPTGAVIRMCDSNATNCTNMSLDSSNPDTGVNIPDVTVSNNLAVGGYLQGVEIDVPFASDSNYGALTFDPGSSTLGLITCSDFIGGHCGVPSQGYFQTNNIQAVNTITTPIITSTSAVITALTVSSITASGYIQHASKTKAQILASTPTATGQEYYCSNCTTDTLCISTGTGLGAYVRISSRTIACQ